MTVPPAAGAAAAGAAATGALTAGAREAPRTATGAGLGAVGDAGSIAIWSGMWSAEEPSRDPVEVEPGALRAADCVGIVSASEKTRTPIAASAANTRDIGCHPPESLAAAVAARSVPAHVRLLDTRAGDATARARGALACSSHF